MRAGCCRWLQKGDRHTRVAMVGSKTGQHLRVFDPRMAFFPAQTLDTTPSTTSCTQHATSDPELRHTRGRRRALLTGR